MDGIPVANVDMSGSTSSIAYVTADQLGTPRAISNSSSTTERQLPYQGNPWGEVAPTSTGYTYNLRFPGQYYDAETGLSNNVNRDYDTNSGRYIQSDPIGLLGGIIGGSPLANNDPLGLQAQSSPATPAPAPTPAPPPSIGPVPNNGPAANEPDIDPEAPAAGGLADLCAANPIACIAVLTIIPRDAGGPQDETLPGGASNVIPFPGSKNNPSTKACPQDTGCKSDQDKLMTRYFQQKALLTSYAKIMSAVQQRAVANAYNNQAMQHNQRCPNNIVPLITDMPGPGR